MGLRTGRRGRVAIVVAGITAAGAIAASPAMGAKFGAKLTNVVDPNGSTPPHKCLPASGGCTRVAVNYSATGAVLGNVTAPVDGRIKRLRLIAGAPGNF